MPRGNPPPPIIRTRIPSSLQQVFIKSNRGQVVNIPPCSTDVSICRNWHDMASSRRRNRPCGVSIQICDEISIDESSSPQKMISFEVPDDMVDSTSISDISESDCGGSDDDDSSIDSVDMAFLEHVVKMKIVPSTSRWQSGDDRDVSPRKQIARKPSNPDIQDMITPRNRWIDGVENVSPLKHRLPPRIRSPDQSERSKVQEIPKH